MNVFAVRSVIEPDAADREQPIQFAIIRCRPAEINLPGYSAVISFRWSLARYEPSIRFRWMSARFIGFLPVAFMA